MPRVGRIAKVVALVALISAVILLPPLTNSPHISYILSLTGVYGILAIGYNIFFGYCGQVSFGHHGFYAIGGYVTAIVSNTLGLPFTVSIPLGIIASAVIALGVGLPTLRLRGVYLALVTLSFGEIVHIAVSKSEWVGAGPAGMPVPTPTLFEYGFDRISFYYVVLALVVLCFVTSQLLVSSRVGRAFEAIREDEIAAQSCGIRVYRYKVVSLLISAAWAGAAGGLYGYLMGWISSDDFTLYISLTLLVMTVMGGIASISGSLVGALFVVILPELLYQVRGLESLIYGVVLIALLTFLPKGLVSMFQHPLPGFRIK